MLEKCFSTQINNQLNFSKNIPAQIRNYFTVSAGKKLGLFFLIIKTRVIIVSKKKLENEIFWGHAVLKLYF